MPIPENFDARAEAENRSNPLTREEVRGMLEGLAASIRGETDTLKSDEKPLTLADVKTAIGSIVESIKSLVGNLEKKFADKTDVSRAINNILRDIGSKKYVDETRAKQIAGDAVPPSLRGLDTDATRKAGDTLKLASNPTGDSAYWGTVKTAAGTPFPWDKVDKGFLINPDHDDSTTKVRIYAGEIDRIATAQTDITVANNDFAYVRRAIADDTMLVANGATVPDDDDTYKYYKLYQFVVAGGAAQVLKYFRPFAIEGGGAGGLTAEGDEVLYKGIFLREYDGDGVIVAAGSEINPADYATQELYDAALVAAGHTLKATWDYTRAHG